MRNLKAKPEYLIRGNQLFLEGQLRKGSFLVKNGKIAEVFKEISSIEGIPIIDAMDFIVMPGLIDSHVHVNEPGRTHWEGFETASKAAVAGGVTSIVDMPLNSEPVTISRSALSQKKEAARKNAFVNCFYWGGLVPKNIDQLPDLLKTEILGFKAFLCHSGLDSFPNMDENSLRKVMPLIQKAGLPLLVHCEMDIDNQYNPNASPQQYNSWLTSRPDEMEVQAIRLVIQLASEFDCHVHIVHLATSKALPLIREAKRKGIPITVETCPHYLYFHAETVPDGNVRYKCAPPIRKEENKLLLLKALTEGWIDTIGSDHSPAPPAIKQIDTGNFMTAWGGIAGLQFSLPVLWSILKNKEDGLSLLVEKMIRQPAKLCGLANQKGKIAPGYDADFIIWDPNDSFVVDTQNTYHRYPEISPYLGEKLTGKVLQTFVMGTRVFPFN